MPLRERLGLGSHVWCLVVMSRDRAESENSREQKAARKPGAEPSKSGGRALIGGGLV